MKKPKTTRTPKQDLKELERAMNGGQIPKRDPGKEVEAATESGARVTISSGGKTVETTVDGLKRASKAIQTEADALIPAMDGVGKAATRMVAAIRAADECAVEKGEAESNLIKALRKAKRTSFKCDGINLLLQHVGPKDKITAQKPK